MAKRTRIELPGGGFHNVAPITIYVRPDQIFEEYEDHRGRTILGISLGASQARRLDAHYCGAAGCCCGSSPVEWPLDTENLPKLHVPKPAYEKAVATQLHK